MRIAEHIMAIDEIKRASKSVLDHTASLAWMLECALKVINNNNLTAAFVEEITKPKPALSGEQREEAEA